MRISDWSSDVCSSDLRSSRLARTSPIRFATASGAVPRSVSHKVPTPRAAYMIWGSCSAVIGVERSEERRVGKECVVRVDLGGRRIIKKKTIESQTLLDTTNTTQIIIKKKQKRN